MKKKLVKLPDGNYVNPDFVTSVRRCSPYTRVWVVGDAGYHTYQLDFPESMHDEIAKIICA
jgi:hypothetical protein